MYHALQFAGGGQNTIYNRTAQLSQPPQLRKLWCALIFYFEALQKLQHELTFFKFVANYFCCAFIFFSVKIAIL